MTFTTTTKVTYNEYIDNNNKMTMTNDHYYNCTYLVYWSQSAAAECQSVTAE